MTKYNIYRINKEKEGELKEKFKSVNLVLNKTEKKDNYDISFYYSEEPDEVEIWWTEVYKDFIECEELPKNRIYFGVLLICDDNNCYAVSLGKSHFYLKQFCDTDFGLNLAERIADENNLKIKNSKFFGTKKNKSITTYQNNSYIEYDSGESMQYIKASTIDDEKWGKTVSFGNSVMFNFDVKPKELPSLIDEIENMLKQPSKFKLPKEEIVRDEEKIKELDKELIDAIMKGDSYLETQQMDVSGVEFIFLDKEEYTFKLKGKRGVEYKVSGELNIDSLRKFISINAINLESELDNIRIKVNDEFGKGVTKNVRSYLDYVNSDRYCLIDGKWHRFNDSYIEYLEKEVDKIQIYEDERYNFSNSEFKAYKEGLPKGVKGLYKEMYFNEQKTKEGYINFDRDFEMLKNKYKIEKMDLYKDDTLYFVKIGKPQKLGYVIDQSLNTLKILQHNEDKIEIEDNIIKPKEICLWIILDKSKHIKKLSELKSLIFHMKLVEWKRQVINAGYNPVINIGYVVD